jgi:hypothetical protein
MTKKPINKKGKKIEKPWKVKLGHYGNEFWLVSDTGETPIGGTLSEMAILQALDRIIDKLNEI